MIEGNVAAYLRASTSDQTDEHQRTDIHTWADTKGVDPDTITEYADIGWSGSNEGRPQFQDLLEDIRDDKIDHIVSWEISRVGRRGSLIQEFFDACEDHNVVVHITDGKVERIKPDGTNRFVADIVGMVYSEERRQLIRRTKSGLQRAQESEGKWLGEVPTGFVRVDGRLKPNLNPDYEDEETGFIDVVTAIENIESGTWSYRQAASETPNCTRQTLSNIHQGERRDWYLENEAEDERVDEALQSVSS